MLKQVPGFPGYYASEDGHVWSARSGLLKEKKLTSRADGYLVTGMMHPDGRDLVRCVHEIVLETFTGPKPIGFCCRHMDGDKTNNHVTNLRWGTYAENNADIFKHYGNWSRAKLLPDQVEQIRSRYVKGKAPNVRGNATELAKEFGVSKSLIHTIARGEVWR